MLTQGSGQALDQQLGHGELMGMPRRGPEPEGVQTKGSTTPFCPHWLLPV